MTTLAEPIDATHAASIAAVAEIRRNVNAARDRLGLPVRDYTSKRVA